jgi:membrane protein
MAGIKERVTTRIAELRADQPWLDRAVRTQEQYSSTGASQQAGAVTYFGFLSVFPILALAFFVVGWVARVFPGATDTLRKAIDDVLPGLVGSNPGQVSLQDIKNAATAVGIVGAVALLYAGLGWVSALRTALTTVFAVPKADQPSWILGKLRDLATMAALGVILGGSVAITGFLPGGWVVGVVAGLGADTLLFYAMFRLLARPDVIDRELWAGALLGGIGFEVLKQLSKLVLTHTQGTPAFQVFGVSLVLLVWINYFTRVTLYAAAFAQTGRKSDGGPVAGATDPE